VREREKKRYAAWGVKYNESDKKKFEEVAYTLSTL
jgi:hypothetical protein